MLNQLRKPSRIILALLLLSALAYGIRFIPRLMYERYGYLGYSEVKDVEVQARVKATVARLKGIKARVVWSSDRNGNPDLFLLDTGTAALYQLTQNGYADTFPRFSPDGARVVFARSTRPYVPEDKLDDWHIFVLDLISGEEKMVAQNATHPQWTGPESISYLRHGSVYVQDMDKGTEVKIWDSEKDAAGQAIAFPELDPHDAISGKPVSDRRLTFTSTGTTPTTVMYDPVRKELKPLGSGRQPTWEPVQDLVLWVEDQGPGQYVIRSGKGPLLNPKGAHVAQECPRTSRDGLFLLWSGAMPNFEIFLWRIDSPPDEVVRLSFDPGNDRWPDIFVLSDG